MQLVGRRPLGFVVRRELHTFYYVLGFFIAVVLEFVVRSLTSLLHTSVGRRDGRKVV